MKHARFAALAAALALAAPARAQEAPADTLPPNSLQPGTWSLSFQAPGYSGGGTADVGAWRMVSPRTNLGVSLGLGLTTEDRDGDVNPGTVHEATARLGLNVRRYMAPEREVTPFLLAGVAGYASRARYQTPGRKLRERAYGASAEAGLGVEWFPVRRFSVAGSMGLSLTASRARREAENPDGERDDRAWLLDLRTSTSRLSVQIYFP